MCFMLSLGIEEFQKLKDYEHIVLEATEEQQMIVRNVG